MATLSAGILMYRGAPPALELLLVHPGGPLWANKDDGAWSIPKGEYDADEDPLACAIREFTEELGKRPISGPTKVLNLGEIVQPSRKRITAFALAGDFDPATLTSNHFELEWPPKSGTDAIFSRSRSRRLVHAGSGAAEDPPGPGAVHRPLARTARRLTGCAAQFGSLKRRKSRIGGCAGRPDRPFFDIKARECRASERSKGIFLDNDRRKVSKTAPRVAF